MRDLLSAMTPFLLLSALAGCGTPDPTDCAEEDKYSAFVDEDGDGYGDSEATRLVCPGEVGVAALDGDCDDSSSDIFPRASELCDEIDNDCDGEIDEALSLYSWYLDADGDGIGDTDFSIIACAAPPSYVAEKGDCDDGNPLVTPGRLELCDGIDNDCDKLVDDDDTNLDPESADHYWHDNDGDGFGNPDFFRPGCEQPEHTVENFDDCDDQDNKINPDAMEICNDGVDDDCDTLADDDDPGLDLSTQFTWYADLDGDGYGDPASALDTCAPPVGYVDNGLDCDDADAQGAYMKLWIADGDDDGFGAGAPSGPTCAPPAAVGWIAFDPLAKLDCDDTTANIHPARNDICGDGIDQDCSGVDQACIADTCADAIGDTAKETGFHLVQGSLAQLTDDITLPGGNECTGTSSPGEEGIVKVKLQPDEVITASVTGDTDLMLYLTSDCNNPNSFDLSSFATCLAGGDGILGVGREELLFHNAGGSAIDAYLVVDCAGSCGNFQLDIDISPAVSYFLPETCGDALLEAPLTTGAYAIGGTLVPSMGNDINLGNPGPSCTSFSTNGEELVVPVELQPGENVDLWYIQWMGDGAIYALTDCFNGQSCLVGDDQYINWPFNEHINYTNNSGAPMTVYLGLDCFSTGCDRFSARLTID